MKNRFLIPLLAFCAVALLCLFTSCDNGTPPSLHNGFRLNEAGDGYITGHYTLWCQDPNAEMIEVPSTYNGLPVVALGDNTFTNHATVKEIRIPETVQTIGTHCFENCTSLQNITIPANVKTISMSCFANCTSLQSITIPEGVTEIQGYAFQNCKSLVTLSIPDSVTHLGSATFSGCNSLEALTFGDQIDLSYGSGSDGLLHMMFEGCDKLVQKEGGVSYVGKWALAYDQTEANVQLRSDTVGIGANVFTNSSVLTQISLPSTLRYIGYGGFHNSVNLAGDIVIPSGIKELPGFCFFGTNITSVTFREGLVKIGNMAFRDCNSLSGAIIIPDSVTEIGTNAFMSGKFEELVVPASLKAETLRDVFTVSSLKKLTASLEVYDLLFPVPNNLEELHINGGSEIPEKKFFNQLPRLKKLTIGSSIKKIGESAFGECTTLESLTLENGLIEIGSRNFMGSAIESLVIPASVQRIGEYAFSSCHALTELVFNEGLLSIEQFAFANNSLKEIVLPASLTEISDLALISNNTLQSISVSEKNTVYASQDGILYNKAKNEYVIIPENIGGEIALPNGVTYVSFHDAARLVTVSIPKSVEYLNDFAFFNCTSLTTVYYAGTMAEWSALPKGDSWNQGAGAFRVVCSDGTVS